MDLVFFFVKNTYPQEHWTNLKKAYPEAAAMSGCLFFVDFTYPQESAMESA